MIKVLLADDHKMVRDGIKSFLESEDWLSVVAEADNGDDAIKKFRTETPDIILMDISMPVKNGMEASEEIMQESDQVKIIMLSMYLDEKYINTCMEAGVHGYIHKGADKEDVIYGIKQVLEGQNFYSRDVREVMINNYTRTLKRKKEKLAGKDYSLTKREKEIVKWIMEGYTSNEIAEKLFISNRTVDTHRANVMQKLKVKNSIELINKITKEGIIE